jgi:pimeloyl-ACP methyl ester carboxylesterase
MGGRLRSPAHPCKGLRWHHLRSIDNPRRRAAQAHAPEVTMSLLFSGKRYDIQGPCRLSCRIAGSGPPVLLVHGMSCTSSMVEMLPVFDTLQTTNTVVAVDLPGFGASDRSERDYTPRLMTDALHRTAAFVRKHCQLGPRHALDVVAYALSCQFVAQAVLEDPVRWGRLAFISPVGLNGPGTSRKERLLIKRKRLAHRLLMADTWSQPLFEALTSAPVVRYALKRDFGTSNIDNGLVSQSVSEAKAEGARFAAFAYLSGNLTNPASKVLYESLENPIWVTHGTRGNASKFRHNPTLEKRSNWRLTAFGSGPMPHFQNTPTFVRVLSHFLRDGA